jgi:hypothetical protein
VTQLTFDDLSPVRGLFSDLQPHIVDAFIEYHRTHPEVFELFKRFSNDLRRSGRRHYGSKAILERVRWHYEVERSTDFKCNNNYTACFARLLVFEQPEFRDFFEMRRTPGTVAA